MKLYICKELCISKQFISNLLGIHYCPHCIYWTIIIINTHQNPNKKWKQKTVSKTFHGCMACTTLAFKIFQISIIIHLVSLQHIHQMICIMHHINISNLSKQSCDKSFRSYILITRSILSIEYNFSFPLQLRFWNFFNTKVTYASTEWINDNW